MKTRVGFVGCYSHDIILILAKVLSCLERKVLVRDLNKNRPLRASVPIPEGVCTTSTCIEYDDVWFTERLPGVAETEHYDIELINFGMDIREDVSSRCSEFVLVTDMLPHHMQRLAWSNLPAQSVRVCIIRDAIEGMLKGEKGIKEFLNLFPRRKVFYLPPDFRDVKNRYVCETMHEYSIKRCSPEMQEAVYYMAGELCPAYTEKEIRRSVRYRERRRYR